MDIKITSNGVKNANSLNNEYIKVLSINNNDGYSDIIIYKYFTFDDKPVLEELVNNF
jgi:hypothetical protein